MHLVTLIFAGMVLLFLAAIVEMGSRTFKNVLALRIAPMAAAFMCIICAVALYKGWPI